MNIVLLLSYEGTRYQGFTPGIVSCLEKALASHQITFSKIQAASRTDAKVHAKGQVVNFFTPKLPFPIEKFPLIINHSLPEDIRILEARIKDNSFHATLDAKSKEYCYYLSTDNVQLPFERNFAWHYPVALDLTLMQKASEYFIGEKDFTSFVNQGSDRDMKTLSTITKCSIEKKSCVIFTIHGSHFHYKMVRNIVGTLVYIGQGKIKIEELKTIFSSSDRTLSGITAPAHGLVLNKVHY
ncbi:MAG: tRNA pseudouridine(38-40) synthase TruA [Chlamydiae bacterium]|nr:tRNA pseudouridine(38-40) synthase TruA [Chlamydiota bacterium]